MAQRPIRRSPVGRCLLAALLSLCVATGASAQVAPTDGHPVPPANVPFADPPPPGPDIAPPSAALPDEPPADGFGPAAPPALPAPVTSFAPPNQVVKPAHAATVTQPAKGRLAISAHLTEAGPALRAGVVWRVFADATGVDGKHEMVAEGHGGAATFTLPPGAYYVYCGFGYTGTTNRFTVGTGLSEQKMVLNAGGLRLNAVTTKDKVLPATDVSFDIFALEVDARGEPKPVALDVKPGDIVRLAAATYTVEADYGNANASTSAEVEVKAGKLSDITLTEKAAKVTLKLVSASGGEAIADTAWSVLTQAGDLVISGVGAFPAFVLAEGDYTVVARHSGRQFQRLVTVRSGEDCDVEVLAAGDEAATN